MRVTICEMNDDESEFAKDWNILQGHLSNNFSDLLVLPEMPFCQWVASELPVSNSKKQEAIAKHELWCTRFDELGIDKIVYSRPILKDNLYHNTAFIWQKGIGDQQIHSKQYFPEEEYFWEASWYDTDENGFALIEVEGIKIGILLCTEVWFTQHARTYGEQGIDLLLCPRATGITSLDQWIRCGQTLAIISGAYCLSSNRTGAGKNGFQWGGAGWIAQPMNGELLGVTSDSEKFVTVDISLLKAKEAKKEYPLYVKTLN